LHLFAFCWKVAESFSSEKLAVVLLRAVAGLQLRVISEMEELALFQWAVSDFSGLRQYAEIL